MSESTKHKHDSSCDYGIMLSDYTRGLLAENKRLREALETLTKLWDDFASQEMYGEHFRAGMDEIDFDEWMTAHYAAREALKGKP